MLKFSCLFKPLSSFLQQHLPIGGWIILATVAALYVIASTSHQPCSLGAGEGI